MTNQEAKALPQEQVLDVACPYCYAQPGQLCHRMRGQRKGTVLTIYADGPDSHESRFIVLRSKLYG